MQHTQKSFEYPKRHHRYTHQQVRYGQGQQEVIGHILQSSFQADRQAHQDIAKSTCHHQESEQQEHPVPLLQVIEARSDVHQRTGQQLACGVIGDFGGVLQLGSDVDVDKVRPASVDHGIVVRVEVDELLLHLLGIVHVR